MTSILDGVRDILDPNQPGNGTLRIHEAYERIRSNWNGKHSKSIKNWKLRFVPLPDSSKHKRGHHQNAEVLLERIIACAFNDTGIMCNQMPVASGLVENSDKDKRRAIDLIYRPDTSKEIYQFLELKIAKNTSDSPRDAAIEVIEYGLLYLFSRIHAEKLGYSAEKTPILKASHIGLRVLAEMNYYRHWKTDSFLQIDNLNAALEDFIRSKRNELGTFSLDFGYDSFPQKCPDINPKMLPNDSLMSSLREAILSKKPYTALPN